MKCEEFKTIDDVADYFVNNYSNRSLLLYAANATGKTLLSRCIMRKVLTDNNVLCYNAFFEEYFVWEKDLDNNRFYMIITNYDYFVQKAIIEQGLEGKINNIFRNLISKKIDINFYIKDDKVEKISFSFESGDDSSSEYIKISKAEESMFIWAVYYSILQQRLLDYEENSDNELEYIIIDDPVTSLDDERIISVAIQIRKNIIDLINKIRENNKISLLITTHNRLFFNILFNEGKGLSKKKMFFQNYKLYLEEQNDSPFGYHIEEIKLLKEHIRNQRLNKIDFSIFRNILEKTANFLGYGSNWGKCINDNIEKKDEIIRLINYYNHDTLSDFDDKVISEDTKALLEECFVNFLNDYKWEEKL